MKNKLFRFRKRLSLENLFGKVYDFFLMLEIKRSNLFKAVGRRLEAFISDREEKKHL